MGTQEESDEKIEKEKVRKETERILEDFEKVHLEEMSTKRFSYERTKSVETVLDTYGKHKAKDEKPAAQNEDELINL